MKNYKVSKEELEKHMFEYGRKSVGKTTEVQKLMSLYKLRKKSKKFKNKSARF